MKLYMHFVNFILISDVKNLKIKNGGQYDEINWCGGNRMRICRKFSFKRMGKG